MKKSFKNIYQHFITEFSDIQKNWMNYIINNLSPLSKFYSWHFAIFVLSNIYPFTHQLFIFDAVSSTLHTWMHFTPKYPGMHDNMFLYSLKDYISDWLGRQIEYRLFWGESSYLDLEFSSHHISEYNSVISSLLFPVLDNHSFPCASLLILQIKRRPHPDSPILRYWQFLILYMFEPLQ